MSLYPSLQLRDRYDRHVRRATLCVGPDAPRHRLAFTLEESLRLVSLPGEDEGRSYYFRSLRITGLDPGGDRRIWLDGFQRAILEKAGQAVYGGDPRAESADAVFFRGEQEALEILLQRTVAARPVREWFWPMVIPEAASVPGELPQARTLMPMVVEKLRAQPASWVAVAAALFARPGFDVVTLVDAVTGYAGTWLEEMSGSALALHHTGPDIPRAALPAIEHAARIFGPECAATLWIAALAILSDAPSELARGTVAALARRALNRLEIADRVEFRNVPTVAHSAPVAPPNSAQAESLRLHDASSTAPRDAVPELGSPSKESATPEASLPASPTITPEVPEALVEAVQSPATLPPLHPATETASRSRPAATRWHSSGLETDAAGLFFLLNVLRRVGLPEALQTGLAEAGADFLPRLLLLLAVRTEVAPDDPVIRWLNTLIPTAENSAEIACSPSCWPANFAPSRDTAPVRYMVRVWYLAVRRWCWRAAGITLRDVVSRPGVFSVNRTDLDMSLPLDQADLRIRKAGLDLDPGWLPWFGWVVRFHY